MGEGAGRWAAPVRDAPRPQADTQAVEAAIEALKSAQSPRVIIGKGVAWSRAEDEVRRFVEETGLPYLAMPMAKGILPDTHDQAAAAARSYVLQNADLIFLIGARLNWMLHYGMPPRFREDVRIVQLDINSEEIGVNVPAEVALVGDAKATMAQLLDVLDAEPWKFPDDSAWTQSVKAEAARNGEAVQAMVDGGAVPMGRFRSLRAVGRARARGPLGDRLAGLSLAGRHPRGEPAAQHGAAHLAAPDQQDRTACRRHASPWVSRMDAAMASSGLLPPHRTNWNAG